MDTTTHDASVNSSAPAPLETGPTPGSLATSTTRLSGRWLVIARGAFGGVVLLTVILFAVGLPATYAQLTNPSATSSCSSCIAWTDTWADHRDLQSLGFTSGSYALFSLLVSTIQASVFCIVAGIIAWRKSDDWLALLTAAMLVGGGLIVFSGFAGPLEQGPSVWRLPTQLMLFLSIAAFFLVFALFPSGRFVPRWTRWVVLALLPVEVISAFSPSLQDSLFSELLVWLLEAGGACLVAAQVYRYWRVSNARQRQQTKWVVLGIAAFGIGMAIFSLFPPLTSLAMQQRALLDLATTMGWNVASLALPVAIALAILRSHLWDIDVIIRRTLVYGTLSAILGAVYFALVLGGQAVVQALTGQTGQQPVLIVASTLLVAALFNPLRRQLQGGIDRRFYRRKYVAAQTLEAFGAMLRTETDLGQLSAQLVAVVQETMQPAHVSLWLRPPSDGSSGRPTAFRGGMEERSL
jgi:hypothetical protein